jgi:hypothetical protein
MFAKHRMLKSLFTPARALVIAGATLLAAACGGEGGSDSMGPSPSQSTAARIRIENRTGHSAWYVRSRPCGTTAWSPDLLGSHIVGVNKALTWNIEPGCKDIRAETSALFGGEQHWMGVNFVASQTDTLRLDQWVFPQP